MINRSLTAESFNEIGFSHVAESVAEASKKVEDYQNGVIQPLKSGWKRFDRTIGGGVHEATIYIVGGRPGIGKSAFESRWKFNVASNEQKVEYAFGMFNLEMPNYKLMLREIAHNTDIPINDMVNAEEKRLGEEQIELINAQKELYADVPIYLSANPVSPEQFLRNGKLLRERLPDQHLVFVLDHTRLITSRNRGTEEEKIRSLMAAARELSVVYRYSIILLSQLNRGIESTDRLHARGGPIPVMSDYFGADAVNQYGNVCIILQRPEYYGLDSYMDYSTTDNLLVVHVLKNRDGPVGHISFKHNLTTYDMWENDFSKQESESLFNKR